MPRQYPLKQTRDIGITRLPLPAVQAVGGQVAYIDADPAPKQVRRGTELC